MQFYLISVHLSGGVSGVLGRVTGVLADTTTKLTLDKDFQEERRRAGAKGIGQGLEGAARVCSMASTS